MFWLLHQTTTLLARLVCRFLLYIFWLLHQATTVGFYVLLLFELYIFWLLHQTTTARYIDFACTSCISFDSYIKPQLYRRGNVEILVVYLLTPTSNHNSTRLITINIMLYIFWLLHQTTTSATTVENGSCCISFDSYIKPQLICHRKWYLWVVYLLTPTSNHNFRGVQLVKCGLYIFWLLHQTTTYTKTHIIISCCISFDSYIKPQLFMFLLLFILVVYLLTPTSNHNKIYDINDKLLLYIFWLLHQTTTESIKRYFNESCISFDSYIKPQQNMLQLPFPVVVYLLTPTSNHNFEPVEIFDQFVVYLLTPTSNHNLQSFPFEKGCVVYLLTPTSNHNPMTT